MGAHPGPRARRLTPAPKPPASAPLDPSACGASPYEPPAPPAPDKLTVLEKKYDALAKRLTVFCLGEDWKIGLFGLLQGTMVFSTERPVAPGTPFFLSPRSPLGFATDTVDVHARASALGAVLSGPKLDDWQTGGLILVLFYNDNLIADRYGILPFEIWGDVKNDDWRFAAGLQLDIFNPVVPNMLTFACCSAPATPVTTAAASASSATSGPMTTCSSPSSWDWASRSPRSSPTRCGSMRTTAGPTSRAGWPSASARSSRRGWSPAGRRRLGCPASSARYAGSTPTSAAVS